MSILSPPLSERGLETVEDAWLWCTAQLERAGLAYGHGTSNAADEAAFLILERLGLPIDQLAQALPHRLSDEEASEILRLLEQRIGTRSPAPYLLGRAYIGPYSFRCDQRALVPRSYIGELLVAAMANQAPLPFVSIDPVASALDLGTGSGCLAVLVALAYPRAIVDAVDISPEALDLARVNVSDFGLGDRVRLSAGDLFSPVAANAYDVIIANPPYVSEQAMAELPAEYHREPRVGLAGGRDGLNVIRRILREAGQHLNPGGGLLCEIGAGRQRLESAFPETNFLWLDTEESVGEVFWLDAAELPGFSR